LMGYPRGPIRVLGWSIAGPARRNSRFEICVVRTHFPDVLQRLIQLANKGTPHPATTVEFVQEHQVVEPLGRLEANPGAMCKGAVSIRLGVSCLRSLFEL
jgi:hypothetical protein